MGLQQIQRALALPPSFRQIPSSTGAILSPKGQGDNVQRHVAMHDWGRCYWHLVTGGVWTPYLYTTAPTKGGFSPNHQGGQGQLWQGTAAMRHAEGRQAHVRAAAGEACRNGHWPPGHRSLRDTAGSGSFLSCEEGTRRVDVKEAEGGRGWGAVSSGQVLGGHGDCGRPLP